MAESTENRPKVTPSIWDRESTRTMMIRHLEAPPKKETPWLPYRFRYRARALFYGRLGLLLIMSMVLLIPTWQKHLNVDKRLLVYWLILMSFYTFLSYQMITRHKLGKIITFFTLIFDLVFMTYIISMSGGIKSPLMTVQLTFTLLFALLFPKPVAILPPLMILPIIAKIDQFYPGREALMYDIFLLIWYSAFNCIIVYVVVYMNQTENRQNQKIMNLHKELKDKALVEERNRIAGEIHDGLGASLSSLIIQLEYLSHMTKDEDLLKEIQELKENAEAGMEELRRSVTMMRPNFNLISAVEEYCNLFEQRTRILIDFSVLGDSYIPAGNVSICIFRILQESLTNINKHAETRAAQVALTFRPQSIKLVVKDKGKGFILNDDSCTRFGIINMSDRAKKFGGDLKINSKDGVGTSVTLNLPTGRSIQ